MDLAKQNAENDLRNNANEFNVNDWITIFNNQSLSEQFMRDYNNIFSRNKLWTELTKTQKFTEDFMRDFSTKIDWSVAQKQNVSCEFLDSLPRLNIRKKILVKVDGDLDSFNDEQLQEVWEGLKYNELANRNNKPEIDVMAYAMSNITAEEMQLMRNQLIEASIKEKENNDSNDSLDSNDSIDDLINNSIKNFEKESIIEKPKSKNKKKGKPLDTPYGVIKILPNGIYEYPQKNHTSFSDADNEFGECNIF